MSTIFEILLYLLSFKANNKVLVHNLAADQTIPAEIIPLATPTPTPEPKIAYVAGVPLTEDQFEQAMKLADIKLEFRSDMKRIAFCESGYTDPATEIPYWRFWIDGDQGRSLGCLQLWTGWFYEGEDPHDLLTNLKVGQRVREILGRWGGSGGWTCATKLGIY